MLAIISAIIFAIVVYTKWALSYWKRRGLAHLETSNPFGAMESSTASKDPRDDWLNESYEELKKRGLSHGGIYNFLSPGYLPITPDLIRNVLRHANNSKDNDHDNNESDDRLSEELSPASEKNWKGLHPKLIPALTETKITMIINTLLECSAAFENSIRQHAIKEEAIDIKMLVTAYTSDVIGSCAFSFDFESFRKSRSLFIKSGNKIDESDKMRLLRRFTSLTCPELALALKMRILPDDITEFFSNFARSSDSYNVDHKGMLEVLSGKKGNRKLRLGFKRSDSVLNAATETFTFFSAGFETTTNIMSYALYELAVNQKIQDKLREEVVNVLSKHQGNLTYEAFLEMRYSIQVLEETLRKYPPQPKTTRQCVEEYQVPGTDVTIEKGTTTYIPILSLHYDPQYYPEPEKFNPERFSPEAMKRRDSCTYLPFGERHKVSIEARFVITEALVGLAAIISHYVFKLSTTKQKQHILDPKNFGLVPSATIWIEATPIHNSI